MSAHNALTVSIIIPVYNEQYYLRQCLDAIASQTVKPYEVIVVDNNSTDSTTQIAKSYPFVKLLKEPQQGALYARTKGFNAAKGVIIGRIDADTRLLPNWVERLQEVFLDKELAGVTGSSHWYDMPLSPHNHWLEDVFKNQLFRHEKNFPFLFGTNMAIRKTDWDLIKADLCTDKYLFEDADIAIHLFQANKKLLYDIRLRAGMSARRGSDSFKDFRRYINLQTVTYKKHGIKTVGSSISIVAYMIGFIILRPLYLSYDPALQKRTFKHLFFGKNKARPHPFE